MKKATSRKRRRRNRAEADDERPSLGDVLVAIPRDGGRRELRLTWEQLGLGVSVWELQAGAWAPIPGVVVVALSELASVLLGIGTAVERVRCGLDSAVNRARETTSSAPRRGDPARRGPFPLA